MDEKKDCYTAIIRAMEDLKRGVIINEEVGICTNIGKHLQMIFTKKFYNHYSTTWAVFNTGYLEYVKTWKHYSGNEVYPIPSPLEGVDDEGVYHNSTLNKWDRNTPYGQLRYDLLDHLIKEFKHAKDSN